MVCGNKMQSLMRFFLFNFIFLTFIYGERLNSATGEALSFSCDTQAVLSVDKDGKLTQFLPGKVHFVIKNDILTFGKIGYITDESIPLTFVSKNKFYAFEPAQSLLYENGLFHHVVSTFEGLTAIQAKCALSAS
jgi:hypothetical protein